MRGFARQVVFALACAVVSSLSAAALTDDASRPRYHYTPPKGNMIDVWGGVRYKGAWRLFYDLNRKGGKRLGGDFMQLETDDFIRWRELGCCLEPDVANGENNLNDGAVIIRVDGTPQVYYTADLCESGRPREHVALQCDGDMRRFTRMDAGKLTLANHGGPDYHPGWSDVWMFRAEGRRFMLISKCVRTDNGKAEIPIYECPDESWTNWRYRGTFFDDNGEVINFAKVDGKWVLIFCPYGNPVYFVGTFDASSARFAAEKKGVLSYGFSNQGGGAQGHPAARGFYATALLPRGDGRLVITAWIGGFINPEGWNGAIAMPRDLTLDAELNVRMWPVREFDSLRKDGRIVKDGSDVDARGGVFDLEIEFDGEAEVRVGKSLDIVSSGWQTTVNGLSIPSNGRKPEKLRILADVSTVEVFLNNGESSLTCAIPMMREEERLKISGNDVHGMCYGIGDCR